MTLTLKFDKSKCEKCSSVNCLTQCQYMKLDRKQAKIEWQKLINGEDSSVLNDCFTCYACEEYCPHGNHPFYFLVEQQQSRGKDPSSRALTKQWVNVGEPSGKAMTGKIGDRTLNMCLIPRLRTLAKGKLFENVSSSWIMGAEFFCNAVYLHLARISVIKERLPRTIENIHKLGVKDLICLHDECYATYYSIAPAYGLDVPFKITHYYEFLLERLLEMKQDIHPLNIKAAYLRNCSTRLVPHVDKYVDDIFALIGVTRVEREYDRKNAMCCGALVFSARGYDAGTDMQKRNLDDMVASGAEYCAFNCPACWDPLAGKVAKRKIIPIHMIDLCRMAIGEKPSLEVKI